MVEDDARGKGFPRPNRPAVAQNANQVGGRNHATNNTSTNRRTNRQGLDSKDDLKVGKPRGKGSVSTADRSNGYRDFIKGLEPGFFLKDYKEGEGIVIRGGCTLCGYGQSWITPIIVTESATFDAVHERKKMMLEGLKKAALTCGCAHIITYLKSKIEENLACQKSI
jgi:hypothetical protein